MSYKHLNQNEHYQIYALMKAVHKQVEIALMLNRQRSTIIREVARNSDLKGYRPKQAQEFAKQHTERSRNVQSPEAILQVAAYFLREDWKPEQIAGLVPVSHETFYRYIYTDKAQGGTLCRSLRCQKKKLKRYAGGRDRRGQLPNRRTIQELPASLEARACVGHWEGDPVIGAAHKHAIVSVVERKSGFAVLSKVENKTSEFVSQAIFDRLKPCAAKAITLTNNNGKEFAEHVRIDAEL